MKINTNPVISALNLIPVFCTISIWSLGPLWAASDSCLSALQNKNQISTEARSEKTDLAYHADPYQYSEYFGPQNAVLKKLLATPVDARNLQLSRVCQNGKVFPVETILGALSIHLADPHWLNVFIDGSDPMAYRVPRTRFFKGTYTAYNPHVKKWLMDQYPDLVEPVEVWAKINQNRLVPEKSLREMIEMWLVEHPEYKNGLLVFPRPSLWNRAGMIKDSLIYKKDEDMISRLGDGIKASKAFDIELIAALFDPELVESKFTDLRKMLVYLAGPHVTRLSQRGTVETIARWILTQYPELIALTEPGAKFPSVDQLNMTFGEMLALIPVEWATGDFKTSMPPEMILSDAPSEWRNHVLPKILSFFRGDQFPKTEIKAFLLKDPQTGERRVLKSGDEVELATSDRLGAPASRVSEIVAGIIQSTIVKDGHTVGVEILPWEIKDTYLKSYLSAEKNLSKTPLIYWLADFNMKDSVLHRGEAIAPRVIDFNTMSFPEDSGDVMLKYGSSLQAPISKGDLISLSLRNPGETYSGIQDVIVSAFERDEQGKVTAIRGYVPYKTETFAGLKNIVRVADGTPFSITLEDGNSKNLVGTRKEEVFELANILRLELGTKHRDGTTPQEYFKRPQSPKRKPFDHLRIWHASESGIVADSRDSGNVRFRIGRSGFYSGNPSSKVFEAPIGAGDEVLLHVKKPGTLLGFQYDRVTISAIIFENERPVGLSGTGYLSEQYEQTWKFSDIEIEDSYIEGNPWNSRANAIPRAYEKRQPHKSKGGFRDFFSSFANAFSEHSGQGSNQKNRHEDNYDIFGYSYGHSIDLTAIEPWTEAPLPYDEWLEKNNIANQAEIKLTWAYWVLQVTAETPKEDIVMSYKKLAQKFHPDRIAGSDGKTMQLINEAHTVFQKFHR